MYEYKVFKWRFDLSTAEELEKELNEYAKDGWRIFNIITNLKGSAFLGTDQNEATVILEKTKS